MTNEPMSSFAGYGGLGEEAQASFGPRRLVRIIGLTAVLVFLGITVFEGAVRYYLLRLGFPAGVYVKDFMMVVALACGLLDRLMGGGLDRLLLLAGLVGLYGVAVGQFFIGNTAQVLFGAKIWLPLLAGLAAASYVAPESRTFWRGCALLWVATVAGVIFSSLTRVPWAGAEYQIGEVVVQASRDWEIDGVSRVAGFSRASYDAARQAMLLGFIVILFRPSFVLFLVVTGLTTLTIYLTTSRSMGFGLLAGMAAYILAVGPTATQRLSKWVPLGTFLLVCALPLTGWWLARYEGFTPEGQGVSSTSSFFARALETWPEGLELSERHGSRVLGRGFGGIGGAQKPFEAELYNSADNLFVYLWVSLGIVGLLFMGLVFLRIKGLGIPLQISTRAGIVLIAAVLGTGVGTSAVESAVAGFFAGMAAEWLRNRTSET